MIQLPTEVMVQIIGDLELRDFACLMRSCKHFLSFFHPDWQEIFAGMHQWEKIVMYPIGRRIYNNREFDEPMRLITDLDMVDLVCYLYSTPYVQLTEQLMYYFDICLGDHPYEYESAVFGHQHELCDQLRPNNDELRKKLICIGSNNLIEWNKNNLIETHQCEIIGYMYMRAPDIFDKNFESESLPNINMHHDDLFLRLILMNDDDITFKKIFKNNKFKAWVKTYCSLFWYKKVIKRDYIYTILNKCFHYGAEKCIHHIISCKKEEEYMKPVFHYALCRAKYTEMTYLVELLETLVDETDFQNAPMFEDMVLVSDLNYYAYEKELTMDDYMEETIFNYECW